MGGVCGTNRGEEKCTRSVGEENLKERDHLKDLGSDRNILLK
jgi:hypothetical protein